MQVYPRCSNEEGEGVLWSTHGCKYILDVAMRMRSVVLWSTHGCMYTLDVAMRIRSVALWSTHECKYILDVAMRIGWGSSGQHMDASMPSM
ncbi:hypothetical protein DPMN_073303 [Dreissena polymorpha]|uniref:Uncharacterized protein n=1 Tax=Dreissena polymorpha TaxID=45954 RepID=A0A9D4BYS7_DREPO|nr:hypothetical protein DPMN_073303 [Dreissena polymorpha]